MHALRALARYHRNLGQKITDIKAWMAARATTTNPALLAMKGVGPVIGAQLLITASSNPDRLRSISLLTAPPPSQSARNAPTNTVYPKAGDRQANRRAAPQHQGQTPHLAQHHSTPNRTIRHASFVIHAPTGTPREYRFHRDTPTRTRRRGGVTCWRTRISRSRTSSTMRPCRSTASAASDNPALGGGRPAVAP